MLTMSCLLFTILHSGWLQAQQGKGAREAESKGKSTPSLSIKESNAQIAPSVPPPGQAEIQKVAKSTSPGGAQPHLVIAHPDHDAGELWESEDIVHTFIVRNTGTAQLDLSNVKAG
jgi:hypothetical protein